MNNNFRPQNQGHPLYPARPQTGSLTPPGGSPPQSPMMSPRGSQPLPPTMPPPFTSSPQKEPPRRSNRWMVILLALSVILLVTGVISYILQQTAPGQITNRGGTTNSAGTPVPTPVPTLTQHQKYQQLAAQYVSKMSLEDMIGQLMFVTDDTDITPDTDLDYMINTQHVGGVLVHWTRLLYDAQNYADPEKQVQKDF